MDLLPGWRITKTAIAVGVSVWIAQLLHLEYPFFSGFAAVFAMQTTIEGSLKEGLHRMQGTIVGAVLGYLFSLVAVGNPLWTAFGLVITLTILKTLKWPESMVMASMVFIIILIDPKGDRLLYAFNRTIDTGLGIVVAYLVNRFIRPPQKANFDVKCEVDNSGEVLKASFKAHETKTSEPSKPAENPKTFDPPQTPPETETKKDSPTTPVKKG